MNTSGQSLRVGLFFILGVALIYAVFTVIGDKRIGRDGGYLLEATFADIKTLSAGADVRVAGVVIGKVEGTRLQDGRGVVAMRIDPAYQVPGDSIARIQMASLLGTQYVAIDFGRASTALVDGAVIQTEESADFNAIIGQIGELGEKLNSIADGFSGFGGGELDDLVSNLNAMVSDNRGRVDTLLGNLESLSVKLNAAEGTLGKLINEDTLYTELLGTVEEIKLAASDARSTLDGAQALFNKVQSGEGTLGKLLADDSIAVELEATMANLREFSEKLNSGEGTLGKLVSDETLYNELRSMLGKADQALGSVSDSGPVTALGAVGGALF